MTYSEIIAADFRDRVVHHVLIERLTKIFEPFLIYDFANVYLNELDQFVKHQLKCKYYLRYCDDFILLDTNQEQLAQWKEQIRQFLEQKLLLELNPNYGAIKPVSNGIDYLGYVSRYSHTLVRKRVVNNFKNKLVEFKSELIKSENSKLTIYNYDYWELEKLRAVIASYLGHFKQADSYQLQRAIFSQHSWLAEYLEIIDLSSTVKLARNKTACLALKPRYQLPKIWSGIIDQYGYYRHHYPGSIVLFQVGSYCEFYHQLDDGLLRLLHLNPLISSKRKALYGFPLRKAEYYKQLLLKHGYSVLIVKETGNNYCRIKERVIVQHFNLNKE
jgi:RNA-directed DNA polymerase